MGEKITLTNMQLLICIICLAIGIRLAFFTGLVDGDDGFYCHIANDLLTGRYSPQPYSFYLRLGMIVPIAFFFKTFGVSEFSAAIYPLLCSVGGIILSFYLGKMLFNEAAGLISAFLLSIFPLDVVLSTSVFPDVPLAFFMGFSAYSFLKCERSEKHKYFWCMLSGFSLSIAYLTKETALILAFFFFAYALYSRSMSRILFIALGFAPIFLLALLYFYDAAGDPLFPFKTVLVQHAVETERLSLPRDIWFYPIHFFLANPWYEMCGGSVGVTYGGTWCGLHFYIFFIALAYSLLRRRRETYPLIIWFAILFLFLEFGVISVSPVTLIHKDLRFLTVLSIPMACISAAFLSWFSSRKRALITLIVLLLISSVFFVSRNIFRERTCDLRETITYLKTVPHERDIYASAVTAAYIGFHFQYERGGSFYLDSVRNMEFMESLSGVHSSYVIVSGGLDGRAKFPKEVYDPPASWRLVKVVENPLHHHNTTIYYIGGFYAEKIGPPPQDGRWRVGDLLVFSGFLFDGNAPRSGVVVTAKFSFDGFSWLFLGANTTAHDGSWEVCFIIPRDWGGRTVYFMAESGDDKSNILCLNIEKDHS